MTGTCGYEEPHPVKIHNFLWEFLLKFQRFVLIVSSLFVVASIVLTVILRYIFKTDLYGLEEIVVIFAFWLYFMGGSYGSYTGTHITADLVSVFFPEGKLKSSVIAFSSTITFLFSLLFSWWGLDFFMFGVKMSARTPVWRIPMVVSYTAVFLGMVLMTFYFFLAFLEDIKKLRSHFGQGTPQAEGNR